MAKTEILNNDALTLRVGEETGVAAVLEGAEKALDVVEDKLDAIESSVDSVVTVTRNNPLIVAGAFVVGAVVAGFVAYKVGVKRTQAHYEQILDEEIERARSFHRRLATDKEYPTPEAAAEALIPTESAENAADAVRQYQGRGERVPYNRPEEIPTPEPLEESVTVVVDEKVTNVFIDASGNDPRDWDYNLEIADREANPGQPYVISFEEFQANEESHDQSTLTYYSEDDVLTESNDTPIDNTDYVVGDDNLQRFGHGSKDRNVVYIRNERMGSDFEVVRSGGSYKKEVLGLDDEDSRSLRHSHRRTARLRRGTDE